MTPILVIYMPHLQGRMSTISLGQATNKRSSFTPVIEAIRAIVLARTVTEALPIACYRQHSGIKAAHPHRRRGCSSSEVCRDGMFISPVHHTVQSIEVVVIRLRFEHGPGEAIDR